MKNEPKKFDEKIVDFIIENSSNKYLELENLYDSLPHKILNDVNEKLILVQILKTKGFTVINWGRGNHPLGPRIVSITLKNAECECEVDKIYYSTDALPEEIYKITERIKCKKASR
ncbi:hypothetical protein FNO01nite_34460 [Flavobacterium noncentrifugens]|nr:hypothetical protein FNO01nite_34460 [Flavobacterium noncentrifugens]